MKRILVPTDFSPPAQRALETAINIAKINKAELVLLHVVDQPSTESYNVEGEAVSSDNWGDRLFTLKLIEKSKKQIEKMAEAAEQDGVKLTLELRMGNPFHGIHTMITEHEVDLVVMGTDGHSKIDKMLIGSNTEKVIRHAKCPVLTIHRRPVTLGFKSIVYATSMMEDEDPFSRIVIQMQQLFGGTLNVVWINTPNNFQPDVVVRKQLQEFANRLKLTNYTINIFNDYSAEEGILQFADNINADLVAMATHGRKGLAKILSGSIAEQVASHARIPVLTSVIK